MLRYYVRFTLTLLIIFAKLDEQFPQESCNSQGTLQAVSLFVSKKWTRSLHLSGRWFERFWTRKFNQFWIKNDLEPLWRPFCSSFWKFWGGSWKPNFFRKGIIHLNVHQQFLAGVSASAYEDEIDVVKRASTNWKKTEIYKCKLFRTKSILSKFF